MFNFDDVTKGNTIQINPNWQQIRDHLNSLFNLIIHQPNIDKIYFYTKYPYEAKYQFLINKRESTDWNHLNDCKTFIEYSNDMDDIYNNIEEYNSNIQIKRTLLVFFDDNIAGMLKNKKTEFNSNRIIYNKKH